MRIINFTKNTLKNIFRQLVNKNLREVINQNKK